MGKNGISTIKLVFVFAVVGAIIFISGMYFAVDWINFTYGHGNKFTSYAKAFTSLLCAIIAWAIGKDGIERNDTALLGVAFLCIVITDILAGTAEIMRSRASDATMLNIFVAGFVLSITAQLILIIRHGRGFRWLSPRVSGRSIAATLSLPVLVYLIGGVSFFLLSPYLNEIGRFYPGLFHAVFLTTSVWVGWETVRNNLYPKPNAYMIAVAMTLWFISEIVGSIHKAQIGTVSAVCYIIAWLFYGPGILLLALSGYWWGSRKTS